MTTQEWLAKKREECKGRQMANTSGEELMRWQMDLHYFQRAIEEIDHYREGYKRKIEECTQLYRLLDQRGTR